MQYDIEITKIKKKKTAKKIIPKLYQ
jgi:hypothetical protein